MRVAELSIFLFDLGEAILPSRPQFDCAAVSRCAWHGHWIGGESPLRGELVATVQIPMHRGHLLRFDRGQATDLMAATLPI